MPRFAANLSWLFQELPLLERFRAAAYAGFTAVELAFPYAYSPNELLHQLRENGLEMVLFNCSPGDWDQGERGIACLPGREEEFRRSIETALSYAEQLGVGQLHLMAGIPARLDFAQARETLLANLRFAAAEAARSGITLLLEAINPRDMPGYMVNSLETVVALCRDSGAPNVRMLLDLYHAQIIHGDLATNLRRYLPLCGHIQVAGVPERDEPDHGEVYYPYLFNLLDELGYKGWVGCEYRPRNSTQKGLAWAKLT